MIHRPPSRLIRSVLAAGLIACSCARAFAQEPQPTAAPPAPAEGEDRSPWRFEFNTWAWLLGIEGDLGVAGVTVDVDADFGDILDASDSILAFSGHLEFGYGRLAIYADGLYSDLGVDDESGPAGNVEADIDFQQVIVDFGLMLRLAEIPPSWGWAKENPRRLTLDAYAGGRYNDLQLTVDPDGSSHRSATKDWLDPIVGAKIVLPVARHWWILANGDVGGFGVESDITWSVTAVGGFDFKIFGLSGSLSGGYRAIGWNFTEGSGDSRFEWNLVEHGAIIGMSIRL